MTSGSLNKFRFSFWLPYFAILLLLIPILIWQEFIFLAKLSGIITLLGLLVALKQWFSVARQINNRVERYILNINELYILESILPAFKSWSVADQKVLKDQLGIVLSEIRFSGQSELQDKFTAAVQLVLASWGTGYINKQAWSLDFNINENACELFVNNQAITKLSTAATFSLRTPEQALQHSALHELKEKLKNL
jgi:hypothetical protein